MKIQSVRIKNFRALKDVSISFDAVTTFIGPNGAGKSTVLRALDWFFNGGKTGILTGKDCSFGALDEDIEVQVTFAGLTGRDREELGKYAPDGTATFTAWKRRSPDGSEVLSANAKGFPEFNKIKSAPTVTEKKEFYAALRADHPELELVAASSGTAIDQALTTWEAANTDKLTPVPEVLQTNFFGFNSGGKMSGLFDFVLVTADLRASEESLDAKASIIGRILERSVDRTAADEEIARIVEESRDKQQKVYDEKFKAQLEGVTEQLNEVVASYSPGRLVSVAPSEMEMKPPRTTFDVSILDGETETAVGGQGHGFQRTLLISALQVLAQSGSASAEGVICLGIEEPELFQHPIQAQAFARVLRSLAENEGKRIQVTYATHSPSFIEARQFHQVRRLTRSSCKKPVVTVHSATAAEVKAKLVGFIEESRVDRQLDGIIAGQLSVALFAHRALIVEGTTESAIFYGLADRDNIASLEASGVSIVPAGGKSNIPLLHAILTSLGIPAYTLFDGDGGFEARANGKAAEKVEDERKSHVAANRSILRYFGLAEVDFPAEQVTDSVAIFADHLEGFLAANWQEWQEACDAVEAAAGISLKKNQLAYRTATFAAGGSVPEMLTQILVKTSEA
ncbi:ATP-dependent nuclease [Mycobacterium sp. NPDC004974]